MCKDTTYYIIYQTLKHLPQLVCNLKSRKKSRDEMLKGVNTLAYYIIAYKTLKPMPQLVCNFKKLIKGVNTLAYYIIAYKL